MTIATRPLVAAVLDDRAILAGSILNAAGNPVSAIWIGPAELVAP